MKRRFFLSMVLVLAGLLICCATAMGETSGTCDNLTWVLSDDGVLTISGTGDMMEFPTQSPWLRDKSIKRVIINEGVTSISEKAFYQCTGITAVTVPSTLKSIDTAAFIFCESLKRFDFPAGFSKIGIEVFDHCYSLSTITVPDSNPYFTAEDNVLFNKDKTELIFCAQGKAGAYTVPSTVTRIRNRAFRGNKVLTQVTIPDSVEELETGTFEECPGLQAVSIPDTIGKIPAYFCSNCSSLTNVKMPKYVQDIGDDAFAHCSSLKSIDLPDTLLYIGECAFWECSSLTSISLPDNLSKIHWGAFWRCNGLTEVSLPRAWYIGDAAFLECANLKNIRHPIHEPVRGNGSHYFERDGVLFKYESYSDSIILHTWPAGRSGAYTIPDDVDEIGRYAFASSGLTKISIPANVSSIQLDAFENLTGFQSVIHIPATVVNFDVAAFYKTDCVIDVEEGSEAHKVCQENGLNYTVNGKQDKPTTGEADGFSYKIKTDGNATITGCSLTGDVRIPSEVDGYTVDCLDSELFYGRSGITSVTIPATVTYFGTNSGDNYWDYVFSYCDNLQSISVDPQNPSFCSVDGVLYSKNQYALINYPCARNGSSFHVPAQTEYICCTSFARAKNLRHLYLDSPDAEWMGETFYGDEELTVHYIAGGGSEYRYGVNHRYATFVTYDPNEKHVHKDIVTVDEVLPTCTEAGHKAGKYCAECDEVFEGMDVIPAKGHTIIEIEAQEPTCTENGNETYWMCSECRTLYGDPEGKTEIDYYEVVIPAKGHKMTYQEYVSPTCTEEGCSECWKCSECGRYFYDEDGTFEIDPVIPVSGHNLTYQTYRAPTCTEEGRQECWKCSECGKYFDNWDGMYEIDPVISATGHSLKKHDRIDATTTTDGTEAYWECVNCGKLFSDARGEHEIDHAGVIPAKGGHSLKKVKQVDATDTTEGTEAYWKCSDCGKLFSDAQGKNEIKEPFAIPMKDKVAQFINRCYKIILGRKPDTGGMQTWLNELNSGRKAASEIIDRFVNSNEYLSKNYNYGDSVDILYQAMLGRNADAAGKANWVKKLKSGQTLAHVINGFCFSKEFRGLCDSYGIRAGFVNIPNTDMTPEGKIKAFVQRCYRIILDREADPSGMQTWYEQLSSGKKAAAEIIDRFVNSPEFSGKNYSHSDSVEILYKAMLGRGSDAAGKANWVNKLDAGQPVAVVINGFCVSKEFTGICASYGIKPGSVNVQLSGMAEEEELSKLAYNAKSPITRRSETKPNRVEIINPSDTIDMNIGTAVQAVYINEEKAKEFIGRCYRVILGREASAAELENWIGQMVNGTKTPDQIARGFLFSNEFKGKNIGNEALVKILYRVYMNRDADPEGLKTWTEKLDGGMSLNDLLDIFSKTNEFKKAVAEMSK